tara:strand:+ start:1554 stop:1793 length:240 start_codon:yes stop_codon:yes gene_type:complete
MNDQLSQAYDIDNRRAGSYTVKPGQDISATDNRRAKSFLREFVKVKKQVDALNVKASRAEDDRFITNFGSFRNLFRASG